MDHLGVVQKEPRQILSPKTLPLNFFSDRISRSGGRGSDQDGNLFTDDEVEIYGDLE